MEIKLKIICGFRADQEYTIDGEESHKAYYLFLNPEKRGVFNNGLAIKGSDIQRIAPDYHSTMGWNKTHKLDEFDWEELQKKGIEKQINQLMSDARMLAQNFSDSVRLPFSEAKTKLLS